MRRVTYLRALEIDQLKRGFFLWWTLKYQNQNTPTPAPTVDTVINDSNKEALVYGETIYKAMKLTGKVNTFYSNNRGCHKEMYFKDGRIVSYKVYSPKDRKGNQIVISKRGHEIKAEESDPAPAVPETTVSTGLDQ